MPRVVEPSDDALAEAAARLDRGEVVVFPTETVYGLGGDALNERAISAIYEVKGRPPDNPLIVHVRDAEQARPLTTNWTDACEQLAKNFWPGALTLVVPKAPNVPAATTAGYPTVALRAPRHEVALALLARFGGPIAAPSANRSGRVSPTEARHVDEEFADITDLLILDGGPCEFGIESTVLDMSTDTPRVLRPGSVTPEAISDALGRAVDVIAIDRQAASPGTSMRHYAPRIPLELIEPAVLCERFGTLDEPAVIITHESDVVPSAVVRGAVAVIAMPQKAEQYAERLYGALREAEASGARRILVARPPETTSLWRAILNRLERAAARE